MPSSESYRLAEMRVSIIKFAQTNSKIVRATLSCFPFVCGALASLILRICCVKLPSLALQHLKMFTQTLSAVMSLAGNTQLDIVLWLGTCVDDYSPMVSNNDFCDK